MKRNLAFLLSFIFFAGLANPVLAQVILPNPLSVNNFVDLFTNVVNWLAGVIGTLAVIVFVWAGILFLTSAGNEAQVTKAKKMLVYAIIGIVIALLGSGLITLVQQIIS